MARAGRLVKPAVQELIRLTVLRRARLSPGWMRVTLGGGEIDRFTPMGYDQWFRIFLPLGGDDGLERIPAKANKLFGYLRYLRIPDGVRPVMRNYSLSNAPGDEYYRISVKREAAPVDDAPDGVCSNHLHANLKEGDRVELAPPAGEFVLDTREQDAPVVLIAGGVGITPLLSMLHQCLAASPASRPVTLIQGALG